MSFSRRPALRTLTLAAVLVLAVLLAYTGVFRAGFIWDDNLHVTDNPTIIGPQGLKEIWSTAAANYFPLVLTNFWLQHAAWGLNPAGYHAATLALHALCAVLLWRVLVQLRVPGAWLGAALWALHPVQVESVAWISELKNTQSCVFYLLAIGSWVRWLAASGSDERQRVDKPPLAGARGYAYALTFFFFLCAILSKPSTVMLPPILGLCAWWQRGRLERRDVVALVPFFALSALAAGWTIWEQKFHSGAIGPDWNQTLPERGLIAGRAVWFYLGKLLWPAPLIFIYPRWVIDAASPLAWVPPLAVLGGLGFLWWKRNTAWRPVFVAATYFVVLLFPVLGFFTVYFFRYSFVGDHFQYLASIGPLALAAAGLATAWTRVGPQLARLAPLAAGAGVAALGVLTWRQVPVYTTGETLWRATIAHHPTCLMAWLNLADWLGRQRRHDESIATFKHAMELKPDDASAHNDLAGILLMTGRAEEARQNLERAVQLIPTRAEFQNNLGNALKLLGRGPEAIAHYTRALELKPDYPEANNSLGCELAESGRPAEAVPYFEAALRADPKHTSVHVNFANALRDLGRFEEALAHYRRAVELGDKRAETLFEIGRTLARQGRGADAIAQLERALQLKPDFAVAHGELGAMLAQAGRLPEAIARFETAARLTPNAAPAHLNLGTAYAATSRWPEALASFERATQADPANTDAHNKFGVALVNTGRLAEAVPQFEAALKLNPDSAEAHNFLGQTLRALGRELEAREHLARVQQLQLK